MVDRQVKNHRKSSDVLKGREPRYIRSKTFFKKQSGQEKSYTILTLMLKQFGPQEW